MVDDVSRGRGWSLIVEHGVTDREVSPFTLPTGTVTFLLSDVEGSTRRWEQVPEAMAVAIPRHYELLDEAIISHGGVRPVEQGEGDSVVGAFSRASDAVAAALAAQRAFATEQWPDGAELRVRMAVHTGEGQLRDEGNYVGHALNRCSRLRAIAYGGQVLVSAAAAALVADELPSTAVLVDLGMHRLKDLGRPEHVWQLVGGDLPSEFPPLRSLDAFRHNLPVQLTPLVGRRSDVAELRTLLTSYRLVTLTGSAGVGKTRLALAVSAEAVDRPGGVWWVELAALSDPEAVGRMALAALGAAEASGVPPAARLGVELGGEPSLLVLDNCEHLIEACADLVAELLTANPATSVLATSREPLGVPGEVTWRVPSLPCPPATQNLDVPALSQYDAVVLFADRARRARPSFTISEANAPAVAQVCHRLDGIPLAIELAAARCRQMSAERIATELDDRFRLLTGGSRTLMARQQTLAASIDWSHERLDDAERTVFRRLGVFVGRFPLEAAEAVASAPGGLEAEAVFELVSRLVDKSLVTVEDSPGGQPRYRLLETLRAYAVERARTGGELELSRNAHAEWWTDWLEPRAANATTEDLEQIEAFYDNLGAAMNWSTHTPQLGLRLLYGLAKVGQEIGRAGDAVAAADRLLTGENADSYGELWLAAAGAISIRFDLAGGYDEYLHFVERMRQVATRLDDEYHLALARFQVSDDAGDALVLHDLATRRGESYVAAVAFVTYVQTIADGDPASARSLLDDAEAVASSVASRIPLQFACRTRGRIARDTGELADSIELARTLTNSRSELIVQNGVRLLGQAGLLARDEEAVRYALQVAERQSHGGSLGDDDDVEWVRRRLQLLEGDHASQVDPGLGGPRPASLGTLWLLCREALDADGADVALGALQQLERTTPHSTAVRAAIEAAATNDEDRWHEALHIAAAHGLRMIAVDAIEGLAVAAADSDSPVESLRLMAAAERLREETGYTWRFAFEQRRVETARATALAVLGDQATQTAAEGRSLDWRDAAEYARRARGERRRPHHGWASLTPTEARVVALVAEGLSNPQIATRLLMGRSTVKTHLEHVFTKLGVQSRAELAAKATRRMHP